MACRPLSVTSTNPVCGRDKNPYFIAELISSRNGPPSPTPAYVAASFSEHSLPAFCSIIAFGIRRAFSTVCLGNLAVPPVFASGDRACFALPVFFAFFDFRALRTDFFFFGVAAALSSSILIHVIPQLGAPYNSDVHNQRQLFRVATPIKNGGLSPAALFRWMPGSGPGMTSWEEKSGSRFCGASLRAAPRPGHGISCRGSSAASGFETDASACATPSPRSDE